MEGKGRTPFGPILGELKNLVSPPQDVKDLGAAVAILMGDMPLTDDDLTQDTSNLSEKAYTVFTKLVSDPRFVQRLGAFDCKKVTSQQLKAAKDVMRRVTAGSIKKSNNAADHLHKWVDKVMRDAGSPLN